MNDPDGFKEPAWADKIHFGCCGPCISRSHTSLQGLQTKLQGCCNIKAPRQGALQRRPEFCHLKLPTAPTPRLHRDNNANPVNCCPETGRGANMAASRNFEILYKETRLNLEPASHSSTIQIRVAPPNAYGRSSSSRGGASADDEKGYRTRSLATASSIYYRKHNNSPRGFLWRVLENGTVLSLRVADVCKQEKEADAPLILNLRFPAAIRTSCIGFADYQDNDVLCVYVVDHSNQLWSLTLRPDHFRRRSATDGGLGDACKSYSPPGFGFKHPHRLAVVSPDQLIVTMHDGGILKFDRSRATDCRFFGFCKNYLLCSVCGPLTFLIDSKRRGMERDHLQRRRMGSESPGIGSLSA